VFFDPTHERYIGQNIMPTASVVVRTKNGEGGKNMAKPIAYLVAGSNARMKPSNVTVVIDSITHLTRDPDPGMPDSDIDDALAKQEARYANNIKEALSQYGSNVVAVVHAKIDLVTARTNSITYPKLQSKESKTENETSETATPQAPAAEPGASSNTGLSVNQAPAPAANATTSTQKDKAENQVYADQTNEDKSKPAGEPQAVSATVSVPRTYFVQEAKGADGSAKQPDPKDVQAAFDGHKEEMVQMVMNAIGIADPKAVSISLGPDIPMLMATDGGGSSSSSGSGAVGSITSHVKEIAVGALAIVSLVMVSMMVKKSAPAPVIAAAVQDTTPVRLGPTIDIAGEASESEQALDGMELDEDAIKANQMVEQVSTMVKENPDAAATMVKRWLNRS
jgi:flagellar biosynthesis/type III secretory pathway M-ring protein FliF/YscJ